MDQNNTAGTSQTKPNNVGKPNHNQVVDEKKSLRPFNFGYYYDRDAENRRIQSYSSLHLSNSEASSASHELPRVLSDQLGSMHGNSILPPSPPPPPPLRHDIRPLDPSRGTNGFHIDLHYPNNDSLLLNPKIFGVHHGSVGLDRSFNQPTLKYPPFGLTRNQPRIGNTTPNGIASMNQPSSSYSPYRYSTSLAPNPNDGVASAFWEGNLYSMAKNNTWYKTFGGHIKNGGPHEISRIFSELKDHVCELMVHPAAFKVMQMLFDVCDNDQMAHFIRSMYLANLVPEFCFHPYGSQAMIKMMQNIKQLRQKIAIILALGPHVVELSMSDHGHEVINECLRCFPNNSLKKGYLLAPIAFACMELSKNKNGYHVVQTAMFYSGDEEIKHLIADFVANCAKELAEHAIGNYVLQCVIEKLNVPPARQVNRILEQFKGNYVWLSKHVYGSHVVEKCIKHCGSEDIRVEIMEELLRDHDFLALVKHPYANYVLQQALKHSKGTLRERLLNLITSNRQCLIGNRHGSSLLEFAERNINNNR